MNGNEGAFPRWVSWAGPVALLAAVAVAGLWLWQTHGAYVPTRPAVGLLALTTVPGVVWLYRARAARRHFDILDAYAEQELARAERQTTTPAVTRKRRLARRSA